MIFSYKFRKEYIYNLFLGLLLISNSFVYYYKYYSSPKEITKKDSPIELKLTPSNDISSISYISVKNRFGLIEFLKESSSPYPWMISSHNNLLAETKKIENLLTGLQNIRIKRQIKGDRISLKNYSMEDPYLVINFLAPGMPMTKIKIGLLNDLKKVAYLQYGNANMIYEASYSNLALFDDNFSSFTNNYPFSFIKSSASKIEIIVDKNTSLLIKKENGRWINPKNKNTLLDQTKVEQWISELELIKTGVILDKITEDQNSQIEKAKKPWNLTKFIVSTTNENVYEYDIYLAHQVLDNKNKQDANYVLFDKYRAFPIIIKGQIKKLLKVTPRSF